jgi:hypothetical protein
VPTRRPSSQQFGAKRWPSHRDHAAKALQKLPGPHLPATLKQLEKAIAKAGAELHDAQEQARTQSRSRAVAPVLGVLAHHLGPDAVGVELKAVVDTEVGRDDLADRAATCSSVLPTPLVERSASLVIRRAEIAAISIPPFRVILVAYSDAARRRRNPLDAVHDEQGAGVGAVIGARERLQLSKDALGLVRNIIVCDIEGALYAGRPGLDPVRWALAERTNPTAARGMANDVLAGADVLVGVSRPGAVSEAAVRRMAARPVVFAMANPEPEVRVEAVGQDVAIMATGRSDYPNQINNVLAFPGVFRGALDVRARTINEEMKLAAAEAIAAVVGDDELHAEYIIPSVFNRAVVTAVALAVARAAEASGVARRPAATGAEAT